MSDTEPKEPAPEPNDSDKKEEQNETKDEKEKEEPSDLIKVDGSEWMFYEIIYTITICWDIINFFTINFRNYENISLLIIFDK